MRHTCVAIDQTAARRWVGVALLQNDRSSCGLVPASATPPDQVRRRCSARCSRLMPSRIARGRPAAGAGRIAARAPAVRIAALSDFHIGAHRHTDGFLHDLAAFGRFLDRLEAEHDRVVLLGDVYQTDHALVPTAAAARRMLARARARVAALAERFDRPPYVHVHGNHDAIAGPALGAPEQLRVPGRFSALFIHGHQFDPVAVRARWAADLGTWSTGRLRAVGLRPLAWWLEQRDVAIKHRRFRGPQGPYARGAQELVHAHAVPIVVMGHTHCPELTPLGSHGVLVNTGTCSGGRTMWVSIDTERGTIAVHEGRRVQRFEVPPAWAHLASA
jgi:UDP-2,3-diacylglucosamine pyrophosphatase LpxH